MNKIAAKTTDKCPICGATDGKHWSFCTKLITRQTIPIEIDMDSFQTKDRLNRIEKRLTFKPLIIAVIFFFGFAIGLLVGFATWGLG